MNIQYTLEHNERRRCFVTECICGIRRQNRVRVLPDLPPIWFRVLIEFLPDLAAWHVSSRNFRTFDFAICLNFTGFWNLDDFCLRPLLPFDSETSDFQNKSARFARRFGKKTPGFIRVWAEKGRFFRRASRAGSQDLGREPGFYLIDWFLRSRSGGVACVLPEFPTVWFGNLIEFRPSRPRPHVSSLVVTRFEFDCGCFRVRISSKWYYFEFRPSFLRLSLCYGV